MNDKASRVILAAVVLLLVSVTAGAALAAGNTWLAVTPDQAAGGVGYDVVVGIDIASDMNVQGLDVEFSFDPAILQAVDADGSADGIQLTPGDCPAPDFVVLNDVDNGTGVARYAAVEFVTNCSAGEVLSIQFSCIAAGSSDVTITASTISDPNGMSIAHDVYAGVVNCLENVIYLPLAVGLP